MSQKVLLPGTEILKIGKEGFHHEIMWTYIGDNEKFVKKLNPYKYEQRNLTVIFIVVPKFDQW